MAKDKSTNQQRRRINSDGTVDRTAQDEKVLDPQSDAAEVDSFVEEKKEVSSKAMDSLKKVEKKRTPKKKPTKKSEEKSKSKPKLEKKVKEAKKKPKVKATPKKKASTKKKKVEPELKPKKDKIPEASVVPDMDEIPDSTLVPDAAEVPDISPVDNFEDSSEPTVVAESAELPDATPVPDFEEVSAPTEVAESEEMPEATPVVDSEEIPEAAVVPDLEEVSEPTLESEADNNSILIDDNQEAQPEIQPEIKDIEPEARPPEVPDIGFDEESEEETPEASVDIQQPDDESNADQGFSPTYIYQNEDKKESDHVIQTYDREEFNKNQDGGTVDQETEPQRVEHEEAYVVPEPEVAPPAIEVAPESVEEVAETIEEEVDHDFESDNNLEQGNDLEERKEVREEVREIIGNAELEDSDVVDATVKGKSVMEQLRGVMKTVGPILSSVFNMKIVFSCISLIVLIAIGYFGLTQDWFGVITSMFDQGEKTPITEVGVSDQNVMDEGGITTAAVAGSNNGSVMDLIPAQIVVSQMYGLLEEPSLSGETGITAATYYGELQDEKEFVNQFVVYVQFLDEMRNLYRLDVYDLLDRSSTRTADLEKYLNDLRDFRVEGNKNLILVGVFMDELQKSYNSLTPDKVKLENDFFAALENIEAEKSDRLLKSFIDVSQKQIALKARVSALNKLVTYYEYALQKLDLRIEGIEKNKSALIEGIRVTDVPGSGIDLIIKPN